MPAARPPAPPIFALSPLTDYPRCKADETGVSEIQSAKKLYRMSTLSSVVYIVEPGEVFGAPCIASRLAVVLKCRTGVDKSAVGLRFGEFCSCC